MVAPQSDSHFADDLRHLAATLEDLELDGLDAESGGFRTKRERLIRSIEAYLVPRLTDPTMPVVVVFAGPTGSGKSTLVNSISGVEVSETGPLRPTTRGPVVLTSAENAARFVQISGLECEVVVGRSEILSQMAFIDTPDIDSTSAENRATAEILIDTADIVVFVTSVLRYADLVPWEVLRRAKSRGAAVISVLNRVNAGSAGAGIDFRSLLTRQDMSSDIIRVPEHYVAPGSHRLPALTVRELQRRLLEAAQALDATQQQIFDKVLDSTIGQVLDLGDRLEDMLERADQIRARVRSGLLEALSVLELGSMCEGVGPPDPPHRPLPKAIWRLRSRLSASQWRDLRLKLRSRLVALVEQEIRRASLGLTGFSPLGGQTIDDLRAMTAAACDAWIDEIEDIARAEAGSPPRLASAALVEAAIRGDVTPAVEVLFRDISVVVRANRGLVSRLEVVYEHLASRISSILRPLPGRSRRDLEPAWPLERTDADLLRAAATRIVARSRLADA